MQCCYVYIKSKKRCANERQTGTFLCPMHNNGGALLVIGHIPPLHRCDYVYMERYTEVQCTNMIPGNEEFCETHYNIVMKRRTRKGCHALTI